MHEEGAAPSGGDEVDSVGMLCDDMQTECEGASPRRTSSVSAFGKKPQIEVLHVPDTLSAMWRIVQEDRLWNLVRKAVERIVLFYISVLSNLHSTFTTMHLEPSSCS
jgi:hypothetical protein